MTWTLKATLTISESELASAAKYVESQLEAVRIPVQFAMATEFWLRVQNNFGDIGVDRPFTWVPLSAPYAKRVGRTHATLLLTGALAASIRQTNAGEDPARVYVDGSLPYSAAHQFGNSRMPARPYFPIDAAGEVTAATRAAILQAAEDELKRLLA